MMAHSKTENSRLWRGKTGGGDFGQKSLRFFVRFFGLRFMYGVMALAIPFYVLFNVKERNAIVEYYRQVHHLNRVLALFRTFTNNYLFGKVMFDRIAMMNGCQEKFTINISDEKLFYRLAESTKGFIMGSSHVGNFELAGYALHQEKKRIHSIIFGGENRNLQKRRDAALALNNIEGISVSDDMSHIFKIKNALDNGDIVSMPCDRMLGSAKGIKVTMCGHQIELPIGPFILAAQFDTSLLSLFVMREKIWNYTIYVKEIKCEDSSLTVRAKSKLLAEQFAAELERIIYSYPHQWFNFYDFWKTN